MKRQSIRVAMITHHYYPHIGGIERGLAMLNPELQARGVELHVITRQSADLPSFERINGVAVHRLPVPRMNALAGVTFTFNAVRLIRQLQPDVVHAHILFSPAMAAMLAKHLFGYPMVVTLHRSGAAPLGEIARLKQKFLGAQRLAHYRQYVDAFISISRDIDDELDDHGIEKEKRCFIPNCIDTNRFAPLSLERKRLASIQLGLSSGPIAVYVGRLSHEKRVQHLLTIWPKVREVHPRATLLVVGDGPEAVPLQQRSSEGIRFIGPVDDVLPYLQVADLFVLPSIAEGLSVALLEAMSTQVPVLLTNVGGALDVIKHGQNGWLIPPDDVPALQEAVLTLFGDTACCRRLGENGRESMKRDYALPIIASRLQNLYLQIAIKKNIPAPLSHPEWHKNQEVA